jgi:hypothetical protein
MCIKIRLGNQAPLGPQFQSFFEFKTGPRIMPISLVRNSISVIIGKTPQTFTKCEFIQFSSL